MKQLNFFECCDIDKHTVAYGSAESRLEINAEKTVGNLYRDV